MEVVVPSELERLATQAEELAEVAAGTAHGARAARLAERLMAGRFLVSFVGEFKRGKSTLINALVGEAVVPTGVLPLTAVATELAYGEPGATVEQLDGARQEIERSSIGDYVTEDGNPSNERHVARVEVRGRWPRLQPGVVLVDTPGIGSVFVHNTEAARDALLDTDGAVVVLSADAPLSEQERELLRLLAQRRAPTFVVVNKADHLTEEELCNVRRFVARLVAQEFGREVRTYVLAARRAFDGAPRGGVLVGDGFEFDAFVADFDRFVHDDLVAARLATARAELARLGGSLQQALVVEEAALDLDAAKLVQVVERFRAEADRQRKAFEDDVVVLHHDTDAITAEMAAALAVFARQQPPGAIEHLHAVARAAARPELTTLLRRAIEEIVRSSFDTFRLTQAEHVEASWRRLAETFVVTVQARVDELRAVASEAFAVPLPRVVLPTLGSRRERFFYLFVHVGTMSEPIGRVFARLVPDRVVRRRALARAHVELVQELDKHAGRARWDVAQRLAAARAEFVTAMRAELDLVIDGITDAAERAGSRHDAAVAERQVRAAETARRARVATALVALEPGSA